MSGDLNFDDLRSKEKSLIRTSHSGSDIRAHLVYPNTYWVGMSNLGFQAVYGILAGQKSVVVERGFLPDNYSDEGAFSKPLRSFESGKLLNDCDLLGFSLSFETDYPHVLKILRNLGALEPDVEKRTERAGSHFGFPLLIAGGTAVTLNPEPVADLFDAIVIGEAEELLTELVATLREARSHGRTRTELLELLSKIEGIYVPSLYKVSYNSDDTIAKFDYSRAPRAKRRIVKDLSKYPTYSKILTSETEFSSMFLTETGRGCEVGCRFCVAGYIYRPVRKRSEESIQASVDIGLKNSKAIGFVGAAVSSHRSIAKLASRVAETGARASLSSLMSQKVSKELAMSLSESEYKTVALAPEAGSERLRFAVGKRVPNQQIIEAAANLAEAGIRGFKLYFIVGLPTETDADIEGIATLAKEVRDRVVEVSRVHGKHVWLALSVNPFVPKANTPFQWEPMAPRKLIEKKIETVRKLLKGVQNIEFRFEPPKESYFQALLSRGDRRVLKLLMHIETAGLDWKSLVKNTDKRILSDVPQVDFYVTRRFAYDECVPWEIVDSCISKELLEREARRAYEPG